MIVNTEEKAKELLAHYLTQDGQFGDREEAEMVVDLIIDAAIERLQTWAPQIFEGKKA